VPYELVSALVQNIKNGCCLGSYARFNERPEEDTPPQCTQSSIERVASEHNSPSCCRSVKHPNLDVRAVNRSGWFVAMLHAVSPYKEAA
jgi:hypothetical protein